MIYISAFETNYTIMGRKILWVGMAIQQSEHVPYTWPHPGFFSLQNNFKGE